MADEGRPAAMIPELLAERADRRLGDRPALHVRSSGVYRGVSWRELEQQVCRMAALLGNLGVEPGARVAQVSKNRLEWIVSDLAILLMGAVHVPIHVTLAGAQIAWQITHSEARLVLLAGGKSRADALAPHAAEFAPGTRFVAYDDWPESAGHALGIQPLGQLLDDIDQRQADAARSSCLGRVGPDDLATIMYTSGTTGTPRGVMLSHGNLASNAAGAADAVEHHDAEMRLCFLPLSHIYGRTCDLYTSIYRGTQLALAESRETILPNCAEVRPTLLSGVPYFYEKLCRSLREEGKLDQPGSIRAALGGRIRACFSGGAALPEHVAQAFAAQDVPLLEGYGLSESSPVISFSTPDAHKPGAVGRPIRDVEVAIADDGEILTRGPHVMLGYWRDGESTAAAVRDGWLHTGDLGRLDEDGFLYITGRKKELIVTAGGKNVVPTWIEGLLAASPLVAQAMVVGEGRNYLAALIVPESEALRGWIVTKHLAVAGAREALTHPRVLELYRAEIDRLLADAARHEQIGRFVLVDRAFAPEMGELTPKGSLCRPAIARNFAAHIEALYRADGVADTMGKCAGSHDHG